MIAPNHFPDAESISFMSPEQVAALLRAAGYHHVCRTVDCNRYVDHCGDHCRDCQSEIDALKRHYDALGKKASRIGWSAVLTICGAFVLLCIVLGLIGKWVHG